MEARAKLLGHPIHQILIVFPLGLLATSLVFDVIHLASGEGRFAEAAYWMVTAGIIGGLLAAPFGLIDWLAIPHRTRARYVGALHGFSSVVMLGLFVCSWILRFKAPTPADAGIVAFVFSLLGVGLAAITGWLGGELVTTLGVGVKERANLNAPNSLTGRTKPLTATKEMRREEEKYPGHHAA